MSINENDLKKVLYKAIDEVKLSPDAKAVESKITEIVSQANPEYRQMRRMVMILAANYPEPLSKRIMKEAVMESNENMRLIGYAIDNNINVAVRTLAVKSKSNIARYEIGNMLLVLGADSQVTKGYKNQFLVPKSSAYYL